MKNILITGGVRSGKSHFAQELARDSGELVLFVATAAAGDDEMRQRIEEHRRSRPAAWRTLEVTTHVGDRIPQRIGRAKIVIIDCITLLVSNCFGQYADANEERIDVALVEQEVTREIGELVECISRLEAGFVIVTNEVGAGLVPPNQMGRLYRDLLGKANQLLAQQVDEVYLMVAGLPLRVKPSQYPGK
ncbi:MAG: bifunctional adenosylcobinamide kinase/adenosylcobinamide-phosphate guanylyltransferase [Dehalococcoidales bacterium]|nr:bifunctional adenosylcobinamide kinase/adenosylcobinamide-phosphate guanylyltransferase [Dehalococcoidales bacterium]